MARVKLFDIVHVTWGQIIGALSALVATRVNTDILAAVQFGYAMLAVGAVAFLDGVVVMAFNQALLSICGRTPSPGRREQIAAGLAIRCATILLIALPAVAVVWISGAAFFRAPLPLYLLPLWVFLYLTEELLKTSMLSPLVVARNYFKYSLWVATESVFLVVIPVILMKSLGPTAVSYVIGFLAAKICSTIVFWAIYFRGTYFRSIDRTATDSVAHQALAYAWPISVMGPLGWVAAYFDRYVLTVMGGAGTAGIYTAATSLVSRPYALSTSILTNYFRPRLFSIEADQDQNAHRTRIQTYWMIAAFAIGTIGAVLLAIAGPLVTSLTLAKSYRANAEPIMILAAIAQTFTIMTHGVDNTVLSTGSSAALLRLQIGLVFISLLTIPAMTFWYGAFGAIFGRCIVEAVRFSSTLILSRHLLKMR